MAHFAQLDQKNNVVSVVVVNNNHCLNAYGEEDEIVGRNYLRLLCGEDTRWMQASYNCKFRKHFPSSGFTYDTARDSFLPPKPYPSWVLNEETCNWIAPIERPQNDNPEISYNWNEEEMIWEEEIQ